MWYWVSYCDVVWCIDYVWFWVYYVGVWKVVRYVDLFICVSECSKLCYSEFLGLVGYWVSYFIVWIIVWRNCWNLWIMFKYRIWSVCLWCIMYGVFWLLFVIRLY